MHRRFSADSSAEGRRRARRISPTESGSRPEQLPVTETGEGGGLLRPWVLAVFLVLGITALAATAFRFHSGAQWLDSPAQSEKFQAGAQAVSAQQKALDGALTGVAHELAEAREIADRARRLVGLPLVSKDGFGPLHGEMLPAVEENLRQAQALRASFAEVLQGMQRQADVWSRIPSVPPIEHARLSSEFGYRHDPFTGRITWHRGLDLAAHTGTPVHASADGRVIRAGRYRGYGLLVELDHGNGIHTRYAHNSRLAVRRGQWVHRGEVLSYVGMTGRANAPHLHYEVLLHGKAVNPEPYLLPESFLAD